MVRLRRTSLEGDPKILTMHPTGFCAGFQLVLNGSFATTRLEEMMKGDS